jgi:hypothetical protein
LVQTKGWDHGCDVARSPKEAGPAIVQKAMSFMAVEMERLARQTSRDTRGRYGIPSGSRVHGLDTIPPLVIAIVYIMLSSLIPEPSRRNFNAIMIAGAGAAYLNGGFGPWEFVFTAIVTFCAYKGLSSCRFIGIGWLFHTAWT